MLNENIKANIENNIEDKIDYDEMIQNFKTSNAPLEVRQEAINYLKAHYPQYDVKDSLPTKELLEQIKAGEADIDDIGGY